MEIDIFPIPHRKEGIARNLDKVFLGILIITYVIAAYKTAQWIVGGNNSLMPHGFTDEELYQIEEAVKLLVELNGVTRMEVLSISRKKGLKQADQKNFCWNIAKQYGIK